MRYASFIDLSNMPVGKGRKPYLCVEFLCNILKAFEQSPFRPFKIKAIHNKRIRSELEIFCQVLEADAETFCLKALF